MLAGRSHHVSDPMLRGGGNSQDDSESEEFTPALSSSQEMSTSNGDEETGNTQEDDAVLALSHKAATTERKNVVEEGSSDETGTKSARTVASVQHTLASFVITVLRNLHKPKSTVLLVTLLLGIPAMLLVKSANRKSGEGVEAGGKGLLDGSSPSPPSSSGRRASFQGRSLNWHQIVGLAVLLIIIAAPFVEKSLDTRDSGFVESPHPWVRDENEEQQPAEALAGTTGKHPGTLGEPPSDFTGVSLGMLLHSVVRAVIVRALIRWLRGPARDAAAAEPRWGRRGDIETAREHIPAIAYQREQTDEGRLAALGIENTDGPAGGVVFEENGPTVSTFWQAKELMASVELVSHRLRDSLQVLLSDVKAAAGGRDYKDKMSRLVALSQRAQLELVHSNLGKQKEILLRRRWWAPSTREWLLGYHRRIAKEIMKGVSANRERMVATLESGNLAQAAQLVTFVNAESNTISEMAQNAVSKVRALEEGSASQFDQLDERYKLLNQMMADRISPDLPREYAMVWG